MGNDVKALFPADPLLQSVEAGGYIGVPLVGSRDEVVGAMIVVTRRDLGDEPHEASLLELLAGRVAGEIERMHAERDLQKSQQHLQAIQRVEAIGTLAGHIAHDFNNLLTIVIGYGEVLQDRTPSQEISELLAAAKRASTLTRQLLAFGRRQMMQVQRVDLNRVVMQVQAMLTGAHRRADSPVDDARAQAAPRRGRSRATRAGPRQPRDQRARRDAGRRHASHRYVRRGRRDARTSRCPPAATCACRSAIPGTGMPPDVLAHIFEPFFTTKGSKGTGLGLSSVYGIVKQSGGFIWCDSAPGQGATFTIYLRPAPGVAPRRVSAGARA